MKKIILVPILAILLSACATEWAPVQDIQKEQVIGYRVTAPEIVDPVAHTVTPAVDYTEPVADLENPLPPQSIPAGATVEPIKVLKRESVVNPAYTQALQTIGAINSVANPTPTAPLVGIGLTLAGYVLGGIAAFRNKQTGKALEAVKGALGVTVQVIEEAAKIDKALKDKAQKKATASGTQVQAALHKSVSENT
jgi:hypothetical protein